MEIASLSEGNQLRSCDNDRVIAIPEKIPPWKNCRLEKFDVLKICRPKLWPHQPNGKRFSAIARYKIRVRGSLTFDTARLRAFGVKN